jgi:hypothetical protein
MFEKWEVFPHKFHCLFGFNEHFVVLIRLGQEVPSDGRYTSIQGNDQYFKTTI